MLFWTLHVELVLPWRLLMVANRANAGISCLYGTEQINFNCLLLLCINKNEWLWQAKNMLWRLFWIKSGWTGGMKLWGRWDAEMPYVPTGGCKSIVMEPSFFRMNLGRAFISSTGRGFYEKWAIELIWFAFRAFMQFALNPCFFYCCYEQLVWMIISKLSASKKEENVWTIGRT